MNFELVHTDPHSAARAGVITTGHGTIETPIFMPVGTVGSVKGVFHLRLAAGGGRADHFGEYLSPVPAAGAPKSSNGPAVCTVSAGGNGRY